MSADIEAHGHIGSCPGYALLESHGKVTKPRKDEFRERVGTIIERTLAGEKQRWKHTWPESLRQTESERREELDLSKVKGDVPMEPGNRGDEQVAVRHADASGGYITENQHEEDRMRDIQVRKIGSEAASEEQSDKWRKTEQLEQEAPNASASSDPYVALEYLASCETQSLPGSVLVQKSGHVDDDVPISALDAFYEKDGRRSRYIGEVLEWFRCRRSQEK